MGGQGTHAIISAHRVPYDKDSYSEQAEKQAAPGERTLIIRILCAAARILTALVFVWI